MTSLPLEYTKIYTVSSITNSVTLNPLQFVSIIPSVKDQIESSRLASFVSMTQEQMLLVNQEENEKSFKGSSVPRFLLSG